MADKSASASVKSSKSKTNGSAPSTWYLSFFLRKNWDNCAKSAVCRRRDNISKRVDFTSKAAFMMRLFY